MEAIVLENLEGVRSQPRMIPQASYVIHLNVFVRKPEGPVTRTVYFHRTNEAIEVDGVCCTIYREKQG